MQETIKLISEGRVSSLGPKVFDNVMVGGKNLLPVQKDPKYYARHYIQGIGRKYPQWIIIGKGGEIYYTPDHYKKLYKVNKKMTLLDLKVEVSI